MIYISTRGKAPATNFDTVILEGIASDGGLYLPRTVPQFTAKEQQALAREDMTALTIEIVRRFAGESLEENTLRSLLGNCFSCFSHPAITPLVQIGPGRWVMELFHGPTLAFKDVAMQVLAPLMGHFLRTRQRSAFIIGATSGDTGGAALAAFAALPQLGALFLYPDGGVSPFQAAQMQALSSSRRRAIPVDGNFDDCQRIVKSLLARPDLRERFGLTAVNSVNWGRIVAQSTYYALAAMTLGAAGRPVHFIVPTGNFGNVYAGILAKRMGFAVGELVIASNENDSLHRLLQTGTLEPGAVIRTNTPAMDIQLASNVERILYDLAGPEPGNIVRRIMDDLGTRNVATLPPALLQALQQTLRSQRISQEETLATMRTSYEKSGYLADPHTAVALAAVERLRLPPGEVVVLATAHPAKFSETVYAAVGQLPRPPKGHADLASPPIETRPMPADEAVVWELVEALASG